jgi:hypothetical protein
MRAAVIFLNAAPVALKMRHSRSNRLKHLYFEIGRHFLRFRGSIHGSEAPPLRRTSSHLNLSRHLFAVLLLLTATKLGSVQAPTPVVSSAGGCGVSPGDSGADLINIIDACSKNAQNFKQTGPVMIIRTQTTGADRINQVNTTNVANVADFGVVANNLTDNTAAIRAAITALGRAGGTLFFPSTSSSYNFASTIRLPKNVITVCGGDSTTLVYTGTVAAFAWTDPTVSSYSRGGMINCTLTGTSNTGIGIFTGGDPTSKIAPAANYGDFLFFQNIKVQTFATGYQAGNNVWENRFYAPTFTGNTIGMIFPVNTRQCCENIYIAGGAIQNGTTAIVNNNRNADVVAEALSIDGMSGSAVTSGVGLTTYGGTVELDNPHVEYFASKVPAPLFSVYGNTPFSRILISGGVIQFDFEGHPTIEATAKLTGGAGYGTGTSYFKMSGTRITANHSFRYTGTCLLTALGTCIEGDGAVTTGADIGTYSYWDLTQQAAKVAGPGQSSSVNSSSRSTCGCISLLR